MKDCRRNDKPSGDPQCRHRDAEESHDFTTGKERHQQHEECLDRDPERNACVVALRQTHRSVQKDEGQSVWVNDRENRSKSEQEIAD